MTPLSCYFKLILVKKGFFLTVTLFAAYFSFAQQKYTISGTIRDQKAVKRLLALPLYWPETALTVF